MEEQKLTIKVSQRINAIMNKLDKALNDKYNADKEFCGFLVASKENVWSCEDLVIPKQNVTGASVNMPKEGKYAPYQKFFEEYLENKDYVIVGTIHSHNGMSTFFSGGDDSDLHNNSFLNFGEGLPFIDIVWSNKDNEYKGRAKIKLGEGVAKQIFTHEDCEVEIEADKETIGILEKIKAFIGTKHEIDEDSMKKSILPKINIDKMMENISIESTTTYFDDRTPLSTEQPSDEIKGGNVKMEIADYDKHRCMLILSCDGTDDDRTDFIDAVENDIRVSSDEYEVQSTSLIGDNNTTIEISCKSKNKFKKLKRAIEHIHAVHLNKGKSLEHKTEGSIPSVPYEPDDMEESEDQMYQSNPRPHIHQRSTYIG